MVATATMAANKNDVGRLANNFMLVQGLRASLSRTDMIGTTVPKLVIRIIDEGAWKEWVSTDDGTPHSYPDTADFREFIRNPWPNGCGVPEHVLERMIRGTAAWEPYLKASRGHPGNPTGANQHTTGIRNNVTDSTDAPDIIPLSPDVPRSQRVRDYGRESKQGNSVSYTLRRLESRPDLLEMVKAGDMSPNAAAVKAGFRDEAITIPKDPLKASRRLLKHFDGDALTTLVAELANHAGFDLTPRR